MREKLILPLICILCAGLICCQDVNADQVVMSHKTSQEPLIDGLETEDVWLNVEAVTTFDSIANMELKIKSVYNDTTIFFLVSFPDDNESRSNRSWRWNKEKKMYDEGLDREDTFIFKWKLNDKLKDLSVSSDEQYEADVWYWKASRTDPIGFADDKLHRLLNFAEKGSYEVTSKSGKKMYLQRKSDAGTSAYKTKILIDYEGDVVPRYILRQPQLSRADIRAKGVWKDGRWIIEFARALITGHEDDVNFYSLAKPYGFGISRHEIAGRIPNPDTEEPLYGCGDITEMLTLEFH